jgi:hypothetical protein
MGMSQVKKIVSIPYIMCIVVTKHVCKLILCEIVIRVSVFLLLIAHDKEVLKILYGSANPRKS